MTNTEKICIDNKHFEGERALFKTKNAEISNCLFDNGESPLKECSDLFVNQCTFGWKYPLWYGTNFKVRYCSFLEMARAGIWYTTNSTFKHLSIIAPKEFRHCNGIVVEDVTFENAAETLWWCEDVTLKEVKAKGSYLLMQSKNVVVDHLELEGDYGFDGCENLNVKNSVLHTKDAFWNCKNATIENCEIEGEYLGWNSENITFIHCRIKSHQGLCYIKGLKLIDCELIDSDLAFEYCSNIEAEIHSTINSVKNPLSGIIKADAIQEIIRDDSNVNPKNTIILVKREDGEYHAV